jgi:hypothetical protein
MSVKVAESIAWSQRSAKWFVDVTMDKGVREIV